MRYNKTTTKNGSMYKTTIYKEVPEKDTDLYFVSQVGDRLDVLAKRFYGDENYWWFIARVNGLSTMNLEPGISLRIPVSTKDAIGS